jgi:hypothetical protein
MSWNRCDRATFWERDTRVDFDSAYYRVRDDRRVEVKLKYEAVADSQMPTSCAGWECLVTADGEVGKFDGEVLSTQRGNPRRLLVTIPGDAPVIFTP